MPGLISRFSRAMVATALLVAGDGLVAGCSAGRTSGLPGMYLGAGYGSWYGPKVRPRELILGADWEIQNIRWTNWAQAHADGQGYYDACAGAFGPCARFPGAIQVSQVLEHHGHPYFAIMKITRKNGRAIWLVMNTRRGSWVQRNTP
jgi:hypothetical protein